jgi:hypothetical protein
MLIDVWKQFNGLLPSQTVIVATVTAINGDGTSTLQTPEGGTLIAQGVIVGVGGKAYVQGGRVIDAAPDLPAYDLSV